MLDSDQRLSQDRLRVLVWAPTLIAFLMPTGFNGAAQMAAARGPIAKILNELIVDQFSDGRNLFLFACITAIPFFVISLTVSKEVGRMPRKHVLCLLYTTMPVPFLLSATAEANYWFRLYRSGGVCSTDIVGIGCLLPLVETALVFPLLRLGRAISRNRRWDGGDDPPSAEPSAPPDPRP